MFRHPPLAERHVRLPRELAPLQVSGSCTRHRGPIPTFDNPLVGETVAE